MTRIGQLRFPDRCSRFPFVWVCLVTGWLGSAMGWCGGARIDGALGRSNALSGPNQMLPVGARNGTGGILPANIPGARPLQPNPAILPKSKAKAGPAAASYTLQL